MSAVTKPAQAVHPDRLRSIAAGWKLRAHEMNKVNANVAAQFLRECAEEIEAAAEGREPERSSWFKHEAAALQPASCEAVVKESLTTQRWATDKDSLTVQPPASGKVSDGWKFVATDGQPVDGLYVAVYEDNSGNFPVALCSYGNYEFNDINGGHPDADDDGVVHGFGWTESAADSSDDSFIFERAVVAYLPTNFTISDAGMKAVRAMLAAAPTAPTEDNAS